MGLLDDVMDGINGKEGGGAPGAGAGEKKAAEASGAEAESSADGAGAGEEKKGAFEYGGEFTGRYGKRKGA